MKTKEWKETWVIWCYINVVTCEAGESPLQRGHADSREPEEGGQEAAVLLQLTARLVLFQAGKGNMPDKVPKCVCARELLVRLMTS